jgi:hypothetical protein
MPSNGRAKKHISLPKKDTSIKCPSWGPSPLPAAMYVLLRSLFFNFHGGRPFKKDMSFLGVLLLGRLSFLETAAHPNRSNIIPAPSRRRSSGRRTCFQMTLTGKISEIALRGIKGHQRGSFLAGNQSGALRRAPHLAMSNFGMSYLIEILEFAEALLSIKAVVI